MSVILFTTSEYQLFVDNFVTLRYGIAAAGIMPDGIDDDLARFAQAVRRIAFANMAAFLCQYHDDTPLKAKDLASIETYSDLMVGDPDQRPLDEALRAFTAQWDLIRANLFTNAGELFVAHQSFAMIEQWVARFTDAVHAMHQDPVSRRGSLRLIKSSSSA